MNTQILLMIIALVAFTGGLISLVIYEPKTAPFVLTVAILMFIYAFKKMRR